MLGKFFSFLLNYKKVTLSTVFSTIQFYIHLNAAPVNVYHVNFCKHLKHVLRYF